MVARTQEGLDHLEALERPLLLLALGVLDVVVERGDLGHQVDVLQ